MNNNMPNKLSQEPSSYLQSARNQSVDWNPWSEEAFLKAKKEGKPVLLSVGAVWCHWCHVQARESWEDKGIADFINKNFVAVKVDRDERPDIDQKYQSFVQMLTGAGGWPLTVFLDWDKTPFFGGTYFPPERFKLVLEGALKTYKNQRPEIEKIKKEIIQSSEIMGQLKAEDLNQNYITEGAAVIVSQMDAFNGGFGSRPKFPMAEALLFLMDYYSKTINRNRPESLFPSDKQEIWKFIELTLKKMASGGVYDQIGGGFHRYSVDEAWAVPHFEKLLTDNALLLKVYLKAYKISGEEFYKKISEEILEFLIREMIDEKTGLFYSSQDADTKGTELVSDGSGRKPISYPVEGDYFTWTKKEIMELLGEKEGRIFCMFFGATEQGNFEQGKNILYGVADWEDIADVFASTKEEIEKIIIDGKKILFLGRQKRGKPFTDKNTFAGWNCLAASAFLDAYKILGSKKYIEIAAKNIDFVLQNLYRNGKVYRVFSGGKISTEGFLDDYIFLIKSLFELYQTVFDEKYLEKAVEMMEKTIELFWDEKGAGFFYSAERKISSDKPILDFSMPAGNSVAASVLLDLYWIAEKEEYKKKAGEILKLFQGAKPGYELHKASYLQALDYFFDGAKEFSIVGDKNDEIVREFIGIIQKKTGNIIIKIGEKFKYKIKIGNKPAVYMCYKNACSLPVTDRKRLEML